MIRVTFASNAACFPEVGHHSVKNTSQVQVQVRGHVQVHVQQNRPHENFLCGQFFKSEPTKLNPTTINVQNQETPDLYRQGLCMCRTQEPNLADVSLTVANMAKESM